MGMQLPPEGTNENVNQQSASTEAQSTASKFAAQAADLYANSRNESTENTMQSAIKALGLGALSIINQEKNNENQKTNDGKDVLIWRNDRLVKESPADRFLMQFEKVKESKELTKEFLSALQELAKVASKDRNVEALMTQMLQKEGLDLSIKNGTVSLTRYSQQFGDPDHTTYWTRLNMSIKDGSVKCESGAGGPFVRAYSHEITPAECGKGLFTPPKLPDWLRKQLDNQKD